MKPVSTLVRKISRDTVTTNRTNGQTDKFPNMQFWFPLFLLRKSLGYNFLIRTD